MLTPEKVVEDGKVAVLISPGFGAGWSTWAHEDGASDFVLFDRRVIEARKRNAGPEEVKALLEELIGGAPCMSGWSDVEIRWVPQGQPFYVNDYDGNETLRYPGVGSEDWKTA